jgi:hypothetical protein
MEYMTPLRQLPQGISFPPVVSERISFDSQAGRLTYRGFMTKYAHDELLALAADEQYRNAVENLFVQSAAEFAPRPSARTSHWLVTGLTVGITAIAALGTWTVWQMATGGQDPPNSGAASKTVDDQQTSLAVAAPAN